MRPLTQLLDHGVTFDRIPMTGDDELDLEAARGMIRPNTRLMILTHASNVSGTVLPVERAGDLCRESGVFLAVDAAQTAGHRLIDLTRAKIDALCVPAHKGLRGPSGIGALLLSPDCAKAIDPLITGGTGSDSHTEVQPLYMPDRLESGTSNLPGIYGLHAALCTLEQVDLQSRQLQEEALLTRLLDGMGAFEGIRILGTRDPSRKVGVVSVDFFGALRQRGGCGSPREQIPDLHPLRSALRAKCAQDIRNLSAGQRSLFVQQYEYGERDRRRAVCAPCDSRLNLLASQEGAPSKGTPSFFRLNLASQR